MKMSSSVFFNPSGNYRILIYALIPLLLIGVFYDGLTEMVFRWWTRAEYNHGFFIPVISIFLIWWQKKALAQAFLEGSKAGYWIIFLGGLLLLLGTLSTLYILVQYAFLITLVGVILSLFGWSVIRLIWVPLFFLIFMIPLPPFLYNGLSQELQLISSQLGVAVIRLFSIDVYLEGNMIDLGTYQLQVVEACSGIRYLMALTSISFLCAYLYHDVLWKKAVVLISAIPIAIMLNGLRIGVIGILVEYWGPDLADGFLHTFESVSSFVGGLMILMLVMAWLARIGQPSKKLSDVFYLPRRQTDNPSLLATATQSNSSLWTFILLVLMFFLSIFLVTRPEIIPERRVFSSFPQQLENWHGLRDRLELKLLDSLKLDDYLVANYYTEDDRPVNLYVAYYGSQRSGQSAHSPRSCLPGGGWKIETLSDYQVPISTDAHQRLAVSRSVIRKGEHTQLVYFWFKQRHRHLTNEYLVKWFLFWDALTQRRTDGALIRLVTKIETDEPLIEGDKRLANFLNVVVNELNQYVPD